MADSIDNGIENEVGLEGGVEQLDRETAAPREKLSQDFESLKGHFTKLRDDLGRMFSDALNTGRSSGAVAGEQAKGAVDAAREKAYQAKDYGNEVFEELAQKIRQNPATATAIAFGVGYIFAKLMRRR